MISRFKKYFIPHKENEHKPHILRREATFAMLIIILLAEIVFLVSVSFVIPKTGYFAALFPSALIEMANADRLEIRTPALKISSLLTTAAKLKAEDMAKRGYFSHNSPEGATPWYWLDQVGYKYSYAGENLAINFIDSKDVNDAWMNSPAHKANILNGKYTEVGIATANGNYEGRETTFIVQLFGRPATAKVTPKTEQKLAVATTTMITATTTPAETFASVKGESIEAKSFKSWIFSSPHTVVEWFYFGFALFLLVAVLLAFFVKAKIQHPLILKNGLSLMLIVTFLLIINRYISLYQTQIF